MSRSTGRAQLGRRINIDKDEVEVDGSPVPLRTGQVTYLINKPPGVVSTVEDPQEAHRSRSRGPAPAGLPGGAAGHRDRGALPADQRRGPDPAPHAPEVRSCEVLSRRGRGERRQAGPHEAHTGHRAGGWDDPAGKALVVERSPPSHSSSSPSTREGPGRSGGCSKPSITPSGGSCARGSATSISGT